MLSSGVKYDFDADGQARLPFSGLATSRGQASSHAVKMVKRSENRDLSAVAGQGMQYEPCMNYEGPSSDSDAWRGRLARKTDVSES